MLGPETLEMLARARADLRMGVAVALRAGDGARVSAIMVPVETLQSTRLDGLRALGGVLSLAITDHRARTLKIQVYDGGLARLALPADASISWIRAIAEPATDLSHPMKGPFAPRRGGNILVHRASLALCKSAQLLPAAVVLETDVSETVAHAQNLTIVDAAAALLPENKDPEKVVSARLPMALADAGRLHVFRPGNGSEEHYAIEIGTPRRDQPVLARLHSACFTGDVLGSLKCDCGPQLRAALGQMGAEGAGVLIYLNQEGRGIGLSNKMRAYALQDQGFDTVEANHRLGFEDDERDFRIGAEILRKMGFSSVRLLTNNPRKLARLTEQGVGVAERVPLIVGETTQNKDYLATKAAKSGHIL